MKKSYLEQLYSGELSFENISCSSSAEYRRELESCEKEDAYLRKVLDKEALEAFERYAGSLERMLVLESAAAFGAGICTAAHLLQELSAIDKMIRG